MQQMLHQQDSQRQQQQLRQQVWQQVWLIMRMPRATAAAAVVLLMVLPICQGRMDAGGCCQVATLTK
jgi:LPS O-antigen subunit length determinant protein (WzzB/FepE family)